MVVQLWVAIVMVIVPMSRQSLDCRPNAIVRGWKEVRGTFMLDFHIGGFIVSCGCLWWLRGIKLGCRVSDLRPGGLGTNIKKLCLKFLWRDSMRNLIISLKRQVLCGKMKLSIGSHMLTLHVICLLQVTLITR